MMAFYASLISGAYQALTTTAAAESHSLLLIESLNLNDTRLLEILVSSSSSSCINGRSERCIDAICTPDSADYTRGAVLAITK